MSAPVSFATTLAGAAVVLLGVLTSAAAAPPVEAGPAGLAETHPPGKPAPVDMAHAKTTFQTLCSKCHDLGIVTAQRHDRAGWNEIIQRMYGLNFVASEEEANEVLEYLVANHPPQP